MGSLLKTVIHVNQHHIKYNRMMSRSSPGFTPEPVLTCKTYKDNRKGNTVIVKVEGREVGRFIYSPNKPLPCGAHVWFETREEVEVIDTL